MRILLVDDEPSILKIVASVVEEAGHELFFAENGLEALDEARRCRPDLVIMDVMMPKMDGFAACRELRRRGMMAPVIFLSAKGDIVDKGTGYEAGGDDYMTKPFDPRELMMHVEALLRRSRMAAPVAQKSEVLRLGRFEIDPKQFSVTKDGAGIRLTPKEFKILLTLARSPGEVLSREQIVESAWGREFVGETSSIAVFVKKLRGKIEDDPSDPRIIETLWGIGYRLNAEACE